MKILKWLIRNSEWFFLPLGLALWWILIPVFRFFDPTTGIYDLAVWQKLIFAAVGLFFGIGIVFIIVKIKTPKGFKILDTLWSNKLPDKQKSWFILIFFSVLLLVYALLVNAL